MTDIAVIKGQLMQCSAKLTDAVGVLHHGNTAADEARHLLHGAMEGTSQGDYNECTALIDKAMTQAEDAQKSATLAAQQVESMAARL